MNRQRETVLAIVGATALGLLVLRLLTTAELAQAARAIGRRPLGYAQGTL